MRSFNTASLGALCHSSDGTGQLKCDGTRAETRFCLSPKRTSPFKSAGASVQSTTGSRGVPVSGSNAGYTMFRCSVKSTGYLLHSPVHNIRWIFKKWDVEAWTGLSWLRIGTGGGHL